MKKARVYYATEADPNGNFGIGKPLYFVPYRDIEGFVHSTNISMDHIEITEVDDSGNVVNFGLRQELALLASTVPEHIDIDGNEKYSVENVGGVMTLQEVENWAGYSIDWNI